MHRHHITSEYNVEFRTLIMLPYLNTEYEVYICHCALLVLFSQNNLQFSRIEICEEFFQSGGETTLPAVVFWQ